MTRKDYIIIADALADTFDTKAFLPSEILNWTQEIAERMKQKCPNLDVDKFVDHVANRLDGQ